LSITDPKGALGSGTGCSDRGLLWATARAKKFVRTNFLKCLRSQRASEEAL